MPGSRLSALLSLALLGAWAQAAVVVARVRDGETGLPLAKAVVTSEGSDIMAVTDADGRCVVVAAPRNGGAIAVTRSGYFDRKSSGVWPRKAPADTAFIDLAMYSTRRRVVTGHVTDAGTKLAIPGVQVALVGGPATETTATDGSYVFGTFPAGPQQLIATGDGYPVRTAELTARGGETTGVEFVLYDTANVGRIQGTVLDLAARNPLSGVRVELCGTGLSTVSDSAGAYVIESVPAGEHRVGATRSGYADGYTLIRMLKGWTATVDLCLQPRSPELPGPVK